MAERKLTRRQFVRDGAMAAAGIAAGLAAAKSGIGQEKERYRTRILNYNENMEYRRLGKTGLMVSAVSLGGHWKRLPGNVDLVKNRTEVVSKCIDCGINYVDACTGGEVETYAKAVKGRRDKMYFGYSWYEREMRFADWRTADKLMEGFDDGLKTCGLDYVDLWRITCHEPGGQHTFNEVMEFLEALQRAKKQGKARFVGISSHDRMWLAHIIKNFPEIEVILTPYTAKSKEKPEDSLFDAVRKYDVGLFGIKPFASNSLFGGNSQPGNPMGEEDDERARLALRYILANDAMTSPIPGLINTQQVDNVMRAVKERRQLDFAEKRKLDRVADEMWAKLPPEYEWLKDHEWV